MNCWKGLIAFWLGLLFQTSLQASFLDNMSEELVVWPNMPAVFASDVEEYKLVRDIFRDLHLNNNNPAQIKAALKQVDKMKGRATNRLWRDYAATLIGHYDRLIKEQQIDSPRLRFSYGGEGPDKIPEDIDLQAEGITALKNQEGIAGVFAFVSVTKMSENQLRGSLTLIRLRDGETISFTVTDELHKLPQRHAQLLFDLLYGPRFPQYKNPLETMRWLLPAPQDQGRRVSKLQAELACQSQGGGLPTIDQWILGEQAGPYHNGIVLKAGEFYHAEGGHRFLAGETQDPRGKSRLYNRESARYYCIQKVPTQVKY